MKLRKLCGLAREQLKYITKQTGGFKDERYNVLY